VPPRRRVFLFEGLARVDALRNRGAISNGGRHITHLDLKLKMDLEKAAGWEGGNALINVLSDGGWGPNARYVGSQMGVTNVEIGAPTTTRLFQAWLQQSLFDDRLALLAGLYPIDSEFFTVDSAGVFFAPQYGTPSDLALTRGPVDLQQLRLRPARQVEHCKDGVCDGCRARRHPK
jgi:porin